jgi:predicted permease
MRTWLQDIRYSFRALGKSPGLTFVVVLSMALAIGANTTVFTWMDNILFNPFPVVRDSGQLLALNSVEVGEPLRGLRPVPYVDYVEWRGRLSSFTDIALHSVQRMNMRAEGQAQGQPAWSQIVSGNYFSTLELRPQIGRFFSADDQSSRAPVIVLSHSFWQRRFGGDPRVLGQQVRLNGASLTVIGVAPQRFTGIISALSFDVWVPVWSQRAIMPQFDWMGDRSVQRMQAFARLRPGVTLAQAQEELRAVALRVSQAAGDIPARTAGIRYVRDTLLGSLMGSLSAALLVITALVLLTACANVANLLMARATSRQKEIAVRLALGASRARITRELLTHSVLLAVLGGMAGALLAFWSKDLLLAFKPRATLPVALQAEFRPVALAFAAVVTFLTAIIFGLLPALRASRLDLIPVLKDESRGSGSRRSKLRSALVIAQVAFSLVALVTAGLFLRSVQSARSLPLGFGDPDRVLLASADMTLAGLDEDAGRTAQQHLLERTRALPGVRAATFATMAPLGFGGHAMNATKIDGYVAGPQESMLIEKVFVADGYFETMEIPIVRGRAIEKQDQPGTLQAAVVNEAFAARYWPGLDPLGRRVDQGEGWSTVVGVAKNSTVREFGETPFPLVYQSLAQNYLPMATLHARTVQDPHAMADTIRREFTAVSPDMPFFDPGTLTEHMAASTFVQTVGATMLGLFGGMALLIAAAGIYGVLAYSVAQRRREIAITVALGATPRRVLGAVLGEGLRLTLVGLLIGGALALGAGRLVSAQLLGVSPFDPLTLAASAALLVLVALAACAVPAWRASRVDPITVLRGN